MSAGDTAPIPNPGSLSGRSLPRLRTEIPGPRSRALAHRLSAVESRNITYVEGAPPIFWAAAKGANVRDVDGNVFVDLTAGFGVAAAGHANPRVAGSIGKQARELAHGLGDVYPAEAKVALLEKLTSLTPDGLDVAILANSGAEAVEAALKTAVLATGRAGILAFEGGYHGLTYGALAASWRPEFRSPFDAQLYRGVRFAPFPHCSPWVRRGRGDAEIAAEALAAVDRQLAAASGSAAPVGAILVEPIQGRGGIVVPPQGFLQGLREAADRHGALLIFDEIYTGFGRTGRWFACQHENVVPDVLTVGKALSGSLPISAAVGTRAAMDAWPPSSGEAIHTSTFLGNPIACAAALAHLEEIERKELPQRAEQLGARVEAVAGEWVRRYDFVGESRGRGLFRGVELAAPDGAPAPERAARVVAHALRNGVLLLSEGPDSNVLALTPPLVITDRQLDAALAILAAALSAESTH